MSSRPSASLAAFCTALLGSFALVAWQLPANEQNLGRLLRELQWVAYSPTNYNPEVKPPVLPSAMSIRADLETLRRYGRNQGERSI